MPCQNDGTCNLISEEPFNYTCTCQQGYTGESCGAGKLMYSSSTKQQRWRPKFELIPGGPKKTEVDFYEFALINSYLFSPCWIEHLFLIIITPRSSILWRTFYFMSNFLWTSGFAISLSLILPRNSGNRANPKNDNP